MVLLTVAAGICGPVPAQAAPAEKAFAAAVEAFRQGRYEAARTQFLQARRAGVDTPALRFNLGVTYYRLERYPAARREFRGLADDPEWGALAEYNLGLVARAEGRDASAVRHFERARALTGDPKLRALADRSLERVRPRTPTRAPARGGYASVRLGHDGNATLTSDPELVGVADESDAFVELLAALGHRLSGTAQQGVRVEGTVYARDYFDVDAFDQEVLRLGLIRNQRLGRWRTGVGGEVDVAHLDGESFENAARLRLDGLRPLGSDRALRLRYRLSYIDADDGFDYLTGWSQEADAELWQRGSWGHLYVGYALELNGRDDVEAGGEFFSRSPTRHAVYAGATYALAPRWELEGLAEYRHSRYDDPDRFLQGGRLREERREEDRFYLSARLTRRLTPALGAFGQLEHTDNESNVAEFDYDRTIVMAGVEYRF
ncbi:MAG: hypothetical protein GWO02_07425 [Gammaproteobacteria bacterium]|nr:hypothetical protein [Gammaproteobacteria bacterium]